MLVTLADDPGCHFRRYAKGPGSQGVKTELRSVSANVPFHISLAAEKLSYECRNGGENEHRLDLMPVFGQHPRGRHRRCAGGQDIVE